MNKERRERLENLMGQLSTIKDEIDELKNAEQEAFDNLPESLQGGESGQKMEGNVEILDEALDSLTEVDEALQGLVSA